MENKSCVYDYVEISYAIENDEFEEEFKKYGTYCGYNSPGVITLDSNHVKVKFVTDQLLFGPGFRFEWMLEGTIYSFFSNKIFTNNIFRLWRLANTS